MKYTKTTWLNIHEREREKEKVTCPPRKGGLKLANTCTPHCFVYYYKQNPFPILLHPLLLPCLPIPNFFLTSNKNHLIFLSFFFFFFFFSLLSVMEVNTTTTTVPSGPPTRNHSYTQHRLHSERHSHNHSHGHFPSKTILIIIAFVTLVTVLFIIFVVLFLIRRQKSSSKNGTCEEDSRELHDTSSRLITSTTLNSSPGN